MTVALRSARQRFAASGRDGGGSGALGSFLLNPGSVDERRLPSTSSATPLQTGDVLRILTPGGGGFGPPSSRDPGDVERDLAEDRISAETRGSSMGPSDEGRGSVGPVGLAARIEAALRGRFGKSVIVPDAVKDNRGRQAIERMATRRVHREYSNRAVDPMLVQLLCACALCLLPRAICSSATLSWSMTQRCGIAPPISCPTRLMSAKRPSSSCSMPMRGGCPRFAA